MSFFVYLLIILVVLGIIGIAFLVTGISKDEGWAVWTGIAFIAPICIAVLLWPIFLIFGIFDFSVYAVNKLKPPTLPPAMQ
jgi:hypothetical protein